MRNFKTLKNNYLLIECARSKHQPIYKEFLKNTPNLNLKSSPLSCPFLNVKRSTKITSGIKSVNSTTTTNVTTTNVNTTNVNTTASTSLKIKKKRFSTPGFCEICFVTFESYEKHVITKNHVSFAKDSKNYGSLDQFINEFEDYEYENLTSQVTNSPCSGLNTIFKSLNISTDESGSCVVISKGSSVPYAESEDSMENVMSLFKYK